MARPRSQSSDDTLKGVARAAEVLNYFSFDRSVLGLATASHVLGVPRSTAYRLLRSLEGAGLLVYDTDREVYRLSLAVARLGQVALAGVDLRTVARPRLQRLVEQTGESALLLVVESLSAIVIDMVPSGHPLKLTFPVGTPWPLHAGASNQVLLAHMEREAIQQVLRRALPRITDRTITDPERLRAVLARIRRRGYAYTVGELSPGVAGVAAPVISGGQLMGAVAVAGPASRLPATRVPEVAARLRKAVEEIVTTLEGDGARPQRRWAG